ncbi:MAG: chromosome segregation protein SMC [Eubacterium sp.]|nr:chromosome segregation protein SMC [Eubacterium sp.]
MYLKSIEVHGFKSFANKLIFEFNNGITGIVGPNGSGKSNVADAVRWVLGEQSAKQLRGASMQDVIFSGTELRKPQSYAYVALTIANDDHKLDTPYEEVQIARKVYRSGESEYLLNGAVCRLRDVQELFFDTGIGKEGYSIIGQGQIDKILSGKPEDRRELFDEAAGIVKYKKRKASAEKSLEIEKQNLTRVQDILGELTLRVEPLREQSEKAKQYIDLKTELKDMEIGLFRLEYESLTENIGQIDVNIENTNNDLTKTKEEKEASADTYNQIDETIQGFDKSIQEKKDQINENQLMSQNCESEIRVSNEKIASIEQGKSFFKDREDSILESIRETEAEYKGYKKEKEEITKNLEDMEIQETNAQDALNELEKDILDKEIRLGEENEAIIDSMNRSSEITLRQQKLRSQLDQNRLRQSEMNQKIITNQSKVDEATQVMKQEEGDFKEAKAKFDEEYIAHKNILAKIEAKRAEILEENRKIDETKSEYHRENSRLETLKNMTERYEGYGQSIRHVMEQKKSNKGVLGVVADIIKVDRKYEIAVETCLGGNIQNIITKDEQVAKDMISFLKENHFGRATFLPLTTVTPTGKESWPKEAENKTGVLGPMDEFVKREEKYDKIVRYLLGRYLLVDTIDHALAINKEFNYSIRIVTLDGELMNPGGAISGGAFKNKNHLLGRGREIERIEESLKEIRGKLDKIRAGIQDIEDEIVMMTETAAEKAEKLKELELRQNTAKIKYDQAVSVKEETEKEYNAIANEKSSLEREKKDIEDAITSIDEALSMSKNEEELSKQQVETLGNELNEAHDKQTQDQEALNALRLEMTSVRSKMSFVEENLERLATAKIADEEALEEIRNEAVNSDESIVEHQRQIKAYELRIEELKQASEDLSKAVEEEKQKKQELIDSKKQVFESRETLITRIGDLNKEVFRLESQREKVNDRLQGQIDYIWNEYELTYHNITEMEFDSSMTKSERSSRVSKLKSDIRSLGDVNVNAIEEYKEIYERYTLLSTQHDDLVASEEKLRGIIEELDTEMRRQFTEKFAAIKQQFDKVFKELFGGGKGTLELTVDDDVLDAGIMINAQPPGKKLTNMMQLSGGEKALTAISLLFAIQNLKPSPFCLLDEIEAALDDSNVKRYAKYLHKLTKNTQFIVITHRKGTMEAADVLYGITMQEKGVSTLVSVKLIEEQLDD